MGFAPFGFWPAAMLSIAGIYWLLQRVPSRGWLLGWAYGVGKYGVGASWIYVSIHEFGNAAPPLAGALVALFVTGMALFPALQMAVWMRLRTPRRLLNVVTFALVWVLMEWTLTWLLSGFPWLFVGYAMIDTSIAGWAPVGGVLLVSWGAVVSAVAALHGFGGGNGGTTGNGRERGERGAWPRRLQPGFLTLAVAPWLGGALLAFMSWTRVGETLDVALVQGNIDQAVKWQPENRNRIIRHYEQLSAPAWADATLVVWPEAAITTFRHEAAEDLARLASRARTEGDATLVLGIPDVHVTPEQTSFRNAALAVGAGSGLYHKRRLVPFGEYVPLESLLRGAIDFFNLPMSHATPGPDAQPPLDIGVGDASLAICYEIAYGEPVRRDTRGADVIITLSNDTWFGRSIGPHQHLEIARMRALENGRTVLRATNSGITAVIDAAGRLQAVAPQFEPAVLEARADLHRGSTPYARFGYLPLVVLQSVLLVGVLLTRRSASR